MACLPPGRSGGGRTRRPDVPKGRAREVSGTPRKDSNPFAQCCVTTLLTVPSSEGFALLVLDTSVNANPEGSLVPNKGHRSCPAPVPLPAPSSALTSVIGWWGKQSPAGTGPLIARTAVQHRGQCPGKSLDALRDVELVRKLYGTICRHALVASHRLLITATATLLQTPVQAGRQAPNIFLERLPGRATYAEDTPLARQRDFTAPVDPRMRGEHMC